jgi:serine/threonine-protein kinase
VESTLAIGTVLGDRYRLTRILGLGGMGGVYEAVQAGSGKRVAVKVMSRELAAHPEGLARFRREVKLTSELAHPHIVQVVDYGSSARGEPYLVMELLDGEDLEARLARERRLPGPTAVQIVKQLASALAVAHAAGIVHRDLKPANVFLLRVPDGGVFVKVVDFGISKSLKSTSTKLTRAKSLVVGTPEYMAPEQAAGKVHEIDHRIDQWSLACIAWQMLSGRQPFSNPDVNALLYQVMYQDPTPLLGADAALISPPVVEVLRRALSKKREERFPTITSFARAFDAAVSSAPVAAPPRPAPEPARAPQRGRRRTWLWVGAFGVALAALAAALLVDPKALFDAKPHAETAAPSHRRPAHRPSAAAPRSP